MTDRKKASKWWWPWQIEKIEAYLEGMARQGWMLAETDWTCTKFLFEKREPAKVRFCVDYQPKESQDYLTLLGDDGWKMEHRGSGWYVWSKEYQDERPEIYTDRDSLLHRSKTILASFSAVLTAQIPIGVSLLNNLAGKSTFALALIILWGAAVSLMAGVVIGMALGISKINKQAATKRIP